MRLARIAHPDGVAFVPVDGPEGAEHGPGDRGPSVRHTRPSPGAPGRWPTSGCWRRSCRPRWWRSAATTPTTPPSWATRCRPSPMMFIKPSTSVIGPRRADPAAGVVAAGRLRGRTGRGDRPALPGRARPRTRSRSSSATPSPTTSPPATSRRPTCSSPGPRATTRSARWARGSKPSWTPPDLEVRTELDGEVVQDGRTTDMVFTVGEIIEFVSGDHDAAAR